jgi:dCMP deaminase
VKPDSPHSKHKPSWNNYFLQIARDVSLRASCPRASCGVVITSPDHRILSTGYNGAPSGAPECMDGECLLVDSHCVRAAHGEQNAIAFAAQHGVSLKGSTLYCCFTLHTTPHYRDTKKCALCNSCRLLVISSGVQEVKILLDDGKVEVLQEWSLEQLIHGR